MIVEEIALTELNPEELIKDRSEENDDEIECGSCGAVFSGTYRGRREAIKMADDC